MKLIFSKVNAWKIHYFQFCTWKKAGRYIICCPWYHDLILHFGYFWNFSPQHFCFIQQDAQQTNGWKWFGSSNISFEDLVTRPCIMYVSFNHLFACFLVQSNHSIISMYDGKSIDLTYVRPTFGRFNILLAASESLGNDPTFVPIWTDI